MKETDQNSTTLPILGYSRFEKFITILIIASAFITLWITLYVPIYDGDIWFHLLYGKSILENYTLTPDHTIYSWTPSSNDNIYCAWIGQLIYYIFFNVFGYKGIIALRYIAASSLFLAILHISRFRNTLYNPVTWFAATFCILILQTSILDKPESISFALMVLMVLNWYKIKLLNKNVLYSIYVFPLLTLIWVNTHGAFIFGCIFLLCVGLGETINQFFYKQNALPRKIYFHLVAALLISAGCTIVTPYGSNYIIQLAHAFFNTQQAKNFSYIQAYYNTFSIGGLRLPLFADTAIVLLLITYTISLRNKHLDFVPIISNMIFAFLFTLYSRTTYLWLPVFSISIAFYASSLRIFHQEGKKIFTIFIALTSFSLSTWIIYKEVTYPLKGRSIDFGLSDAFSIDEEIEFIQKYFPNNILANVYDHGAYILWKTWPKRKVMIDARYFPYENIFKEYLDFEYGEDIESFIAKYPFDVIELKHDSVILIQWLFKSKEWKLAFYGKGAVVFVRSFLILPEMPIRGNSLTNILDYGISLTVFNTTIFTKDWVGADIVLSTMRRNFKFEHQKETITGLEHIKLAAQLYEQRDYATSIQHMEKAMEKKISNANLYAAALLMKANKDWRDRHMSEAIKNAIKSLQVKSSFAAKYNVALMAFQVETLQKNGHKIDLSLTNQEQMIIERWREIFAALVKNKSKLDKSYLQFAENASDILRSNSSFHTQPIDPDWR